MHPVLAIELTPQGDGTRLRQTVEFEFLPRLRPIGWLVERLFVERAMVNGLRDTVENAKRMAEAAGPRSAVLD